MVVSILQHRNLKENIEIYYAVLFIIVKEAAVGLCQGDGLVPGGFLARNLIPLKIRCVLGLFQVESYVWCETPSRWYGAEVWKGDTISGVVFVI
ncbi:hypothetical protein AVEN_27420-1 [Araneus ventricosus]|uniref:Uncharacterized protein n=1 Tax=Araneus ventricosus TaxID=182803 RepID=A0A4Y2EIF3_ARAVE|nr:hypothetical protein AVEN_27420-1 [Araneus ventricosus]